MIICLDLETTWLDRKNDAIIEIAMVAFDEKTFEIKAEYSKLVNPGRELDAMISNITNIFDEDLVGQPSFEDLRDEIEDFIWDHPILGHNIMFDVEFLKNAHVELRNNITLDTFSLSNFLSYEMHSLSLEYLVAEYKWKLDGAHRALNDVHATIDLFQIYSQKLAELDGVKKTFLGYVYGQTLDPWLKFIFQNYANIKTIKPKKFIDEFIGIFDTGKGYDQIHKADKKIKEKFWDITKQFWDIESRPNQEAMADIIAKNYISKQKTIIEAPTWVGKTFAYLIPSIIHSLNTGKQVFISTNTKALQDQIIFKDLAFLSENLKYDFSYCKVKWKRNYIGVYSFLDFLESKQSFDITQSSFILKMLFWMSETKDGELDELDFYGQEYGFLRDINAENVMTFSSKNPYEDFEFAVRARRQARKANVTVINHAMLFQNLSWDNSILGEIEHLILDEAHNLEDTITWALKKWFSLDDLEKTFSKIQAKFTQHNFTEISFLPKADDVLFKAGMLFGLLEDYLNSKVGIWQKYRNSLLRDDFFIADNIDKAWLILELKNLLLGLIDELTNSPEHVYNDVNREISHLNHVYDIIDNSFEKEKAQQNIVMVSWRDNKGIILEYTLLNPGEYLSKKLWNSLESCVVTSATLKIWDSFDYIKNILHLEEFSSHCLETDFDYSQQSLLFIPNDLWSIKHNISEVLFFLRQLFIKTGWSTLALTTAFSVIKQIYTDMNLDLKNKGITLYAQSIWWWKHKLIEFYKKSSHNSVLVGTDTFWEWIDIPWEDLKYLVIHKIPFMVPSDPIFQARSELFKNSFAEYSVPKSILKLKQWFGRLIRTKSDTGVVIFLDDRIYSTGWGKIFYDAFPENINKKIGPSESLLKIIK